MNTYGILITRAQPFHKGHLSVIDQILHENDYAVVIIGSANKKGNERNPLPGEFRYDYIKNAIKTNYSSSNQKRIRLMKLDDWSTENGKNHLKEWGYFLYYNIVNEIHQKTFSIYYNDNPEFVMNWFDEILRDRITIKTIDRTRESAVIISSTEIRKMLTEENYDEAAQYLACEYMDIHTISKYITEAIKNPEPDYVMQ